MIDHNQETKNAIIAMNAIRRMGIADTDSDIAREIGYDKTSLNNVKGSLRNLPTKYLTKLADAYRLNKNFIFKNALPIFDPQGPFHKYNNISDPNNQDLMERLDRIEETQKQILALLLDSKIKK